MEMRFDLAIASIAAAIALESHSLDRPPPLNCAAAPLVEFYSRLEQQQHALLMNAWALGGN